MSPMHPKATDTSLRISCRDGPNPDIRRTLLHHLEGEVSRQTLAYSHARAAAAMPACI
jgi:hypothetical protein